MLNIMTMTNYHLKLRHEYHYHCICTCKIFCLEGRMNCPFWRIHCLVLRIHCLVWRIHCLVSAESAVGLSGDVTLPIPTDVMRQTVPPAGNTFSVVRLSESYAETLAPHGYWSMQFYLPDDAYLQWNSTIPRAASLAVYGRRNALPTHTHFDVHQVLRGYSRRHRRTSGVSREG